MRWLEPIRRALGHAPAYTGSRWVMLDVETSGLDMRHDRLLAIAAIALRVDWQRRTLSVALGDSFEVVVQQDEASSKDNILLHGIGAQMQRNGMPAAQALQAFENYVQDSPLLAFHAAFDRSMINRHARQHPNGEVALEAAHPLRQG